MAQNARVYYDLREVGGGSKLGGTEGPQDESVHNGLFFFEVS